MKTIGFIGGMSWESSVVYYQLANKRVSELAGGNHSCKNIMYTVDFDEIVHLQHSGQWDKLDDLMADAAVRCEKAGADVIVLCTNTMHICKEAIIRQITVPFLHIAHATGDAISLWGFKNSVVNLEYIDSTNTPKNIEVKSPNFSFNNLIAL